MANSTKTLASSKGSLHHRLYAWVLSLARHNHATTALCALSFAESSFFPIAPDVLQIPMTLARPEKAWFYALINTVASVLGGIFGYLIGWQIWHFIAPYAHAYIFDEALFHQVESLYKEWSFWAVFIASFTPIPYKFFTLAAGACQIAFLPFVLASLIGRGARFFLVAAFLHRFGEPIQKRLERYFNLFTIVLIIIIILAIIGWHKL